MHRILLSVIMGFVTLTAVGVTGRFYSSELLASSSITSICQDMAGYMWIGTENGLCRFDGYKFTVYKNVPEDSTSLMFNIVNKVFCDKDGNLWVGTNTGLQRYDEATDRFIRYDSPLFERARISDICQFAGGKWNKMMQDKHIGYTQWSMPNKNINPTTLGFDVSHAICPSPAGEAEEGSEYSIPAYQFSRKTDGKGAAWTLLPDLGRGKGCMGSSNVLAQNSGATLEYDIDITSEGKVAIGILPTQDIYPARGLRIGIQVDDQPMQTIDARRGLVDTFSEYNPQNLAHSKVLKPLPPRSRLALSGFWKGRQLSRRDEVFDNLRWLDATFEGLTPGKHTLKVVMIDPEIVVEQIVVNPDNNHYSYFGKR